MTDKFDVCIHCRYYKKKCVQGRLVSEKCTNHRMNGSLHFLKCEGFSRSLKSYLRLV